MYYEAIIIAVGVLGLLLLFAGLRRLWRRRFITGSLQGLSGAALITLALLLFALLGNFYIYHRLTDEQALARLQFDALGPQYYRATIRYPTGGQLVLDVHGDEWQLDARVLKWRGYATLVGFDTLYRLDRFSGRYRDIEQEKHYERSVYALTADPKFDLWTVAKRYKDWLPWVDTLYGSATYMPMADHALYAVSVSQSGLVARPLNEPARAAIGQWR